MGMERAVLNYTIMSEAGTAGDLGPRSRKWSRWDYLPFHCFMVTEVGKARRGGAPWLPEV